MFGLFKRTDPLWQKFVEEAEKKVEFTPDWRELQLLDAVNIFVYNEFQSNQPQHYMLGEAGYGGIGYTSSSDFVLYKKLLGKETFPFAMPISEENKLGMSSFLGDPGQIMGEVYSIDPKTIIKLDSYVLNTVYFDRKRTKVLIPFRPAGPDRSDNMEVREVEVFMWVARPEFWLELISSGEHRKLYARSHRIFNVQQSDTTLGAHYLFDYNFEAKAS